MRSIDDLFELTMIESKYASGERTSVMGVILLSIASALGLLSLALGQALESSFAFYLLLAASVVLGIVGLANYIWGKDMAQEAFKEGKALAHPEDEGSTKRP